MSTDQDKIKQERDDLSWVISTEQGRRFVWRLLTYCRVHADIGGPHEVVYKELGKRNVGLFLEGIISDASEDRLFEMMREAKNRAIEEQLNERRRHPDTDTRSIDTVNGSVTTNDIVGLPGYATEPGPNI